MSDSGRYIGFTCPNCGSHYFGTFTNIRGLNKNYQQNTVVGYCKENEYSGNGCQYQWVRDDKEQEDKVMYKPSFDEYMARYKENLII